MLPDRHELLIAGGHVVTLDDAGDLPVGDVHVRDGAVVAVGTDLAAPGADRVDARGAIVLPGLVETHWHMWNAVLRGLSDGLPGPPPGASGTTRGYFAVCAELAPSFTPADAAAGVRAACAEAVAAGCTTVHDWAHNVRGPEYADAELEALHASGLRARFSYGWPNGHPPTTPMDLDDLARRRDEGLVTVGMASRGIGGPNPRARVDPAQHRAEIAAARGLGLPISVHASGPRGARGQIGLLADAGTLGPDLQVIHAVVAEPAEIAAMAERRCSVSLSPFTEMLIGYGFPQTGALLAAGVTTGLSVDTTVLSGDADPFAIMKAILAVANGLAEDEFAVSPRRVLEMATIDGARSLGLDHLVGSLRPGKRADLIVVRPPGSADPARLLVTATTPADVDTVVVDGRVLKRHGTLTAEDPDDVARATARAQRDVLVRAGR